MVSGRRSNDHVNGFGSTKIVQCKNGRVHLNGLSWREGRNAIVEWMAEEVMAVLQGADIGAAVVENVQVLMEHDEQLAHRGYYVDSAHHDPEVGTLRIPSFPIAPGRFCGQRQ